MHKFNPDCEKRLTWRTIDGMDTAARAPVPGSGKGLNIRLAHSMFTPPGVRRSVF
jgi:hypothetical protein